MELVEQIRAAQVELGWTVQQLLEKSGLSLDRTTLQRKLTGKTGSTFTELLALAAAIKKARPTFDLKWPDGTPDLRLGVPSPLRRRNAG
jgi:transcriptional regulator with XRE-family HTH domain